MVHERQGSGAEGDGVTLGLRGQDSGKRPLQLAHGHFVKGGAGDHPLDELRRQAATDDDGLRIVNRGNGSQDLG